MFHVCQKKNHFHMWNVQVLKGSEEMDGFSVCKVKKLSVKLQSKYGVRSCYKVAYKAAQS